MRVGIALGSNLPDRLLNLRRACEYLGPIHDGTGPILRSQVYETTPLDCPPDSPTFLNAAVEISTSCPPLDLLKHLQEIETLMGRPADHAFHAPRTIDLDLLYCDNLQLSHTSLTLPHPRIAERPFVLYPLNDICPQRILPTTHRTIRELLDLLPSGSNLQSFAFL